MGQAQQKRRLMEVLSHREEKVIVKVNIAAPVFFMHDDLSNGTLMVDLGLLTLWNYGEGVQKKNYDGWRLVLEDIQVLTQPRPRSIPKPKFYLTKHESTCHVIEPFSLDFMVETKFGVIEWAADNPYAIMSSEVLIKKENNIPSVIKYLLPKIKIS